jgi:hypothetical protein
VQASASDGGRSLGRASSLPDLATTAHAPTRARMGSTTAVADYLHGSRDTTVAGGLSNSGMTSGYTASEEDGLSLLIHGSPISDGLQDDEEGGSSGLHLLDYESENDGQTAVSTNPKEVQSGYHVQLQEPAAMDTEPPTKGCSGSTTQAEVAPELDAVYYQCKSARTSLYKDTLISVYQDETFGKKIVAPSTAIGSLDDSRDVALTFHGSRLMRGNDTVNQSISSTFDPSTLTCICCKAEHLVFGKRPSVVIMTDQNFVTSLCSSDCNCVQIVRLENASLVELFDLAVEMMGAVNFAEGSIFLFGSVSHLGRYGTSVYAKDWTDVVARASRTWHGVRICPLIPLIRAECPGSVIRELSELAMWLETVYGTDPQGLHGTWMQLVAAMEACSVGTTSLDVMETYKIVLPSSLQCSNLDSVITFCSHNSRPVTCHGLPKDSCAELLSSLLKEIHENFRACSSPENYLGRADGRETQSETQAEQKVLLVGASNLRHSLPHFTGTSVTFSNITTAGWTPTADNLKKLEDAISEKASETEAFVFDLLGNSSIRFEQEDGTTALPFKSNGRFHLGGSVVVTPPDTFKGVVNKVFRIISSKGNKPCVIIPPLPRYLFARCCNDPDHCTNATDTNFSRKLLTGFTEMRNALIRQLVSAGLTNFKVMDVCCTTTCSATACTDERLKGLKSVTAKDGVHFVDAGYKNLAKRCMDCLSKMLSPESHIPEKTGKPTCFFWRGFRSTRGSNYKRSHSETSRGARGPSAGGARGRAGSARGRAGSARGRARAARGQVHRGIFSKFHPYRRW